MENILTGDNQLASLIVTSWSQQFLETLRLNLVFQDSVDNSYQGDASKLGATVTINQIPDFNEADLLAQGEKGVADEVSSTSQNLTINKRPYKDVIVEDTAMLQSVPFMDSLQDAMTFSVLRRVQSEVVNAIVPSASAPDHTIAFTAGTTLALADILAAKELLDTQNVPFQGRSMVVGAAQLNDLFNIGEFTSRDFNGGETVMLNGTFSQPFVGFVGKFTTQVANTVYFLHRRMVTMAFQKQLNAEVASGTWDGVRGKRINMDLLMGIKQLDSKRGCTVS